VLECASFNEASLGGFIMRVRAAYALFRSAKTDNQTTPGVSARQPVHGRSARTGMFYSSVFQIHDNRAAEHSARVKEIDTELTRVRSELNEALNSGKSAEYRAEKMAQLFPRIQELEKTIQQLHRVNTSTLDYFDQVANEEPVKATLLKT
jgi:hypothetical protein